MVIFLLQKLQDETAAKPIEVKKSQETNEASFTNPMRLPKHLQDSARADYAMTAKVEQQTQRDEVVDPKPEAVFQVRPSPSKENFTQVQFQEMRQSKEYDIDEEYDDDNGEDNYDEYDPDYEHNEYDHEYNEDVSVKISVFKRDATFEYFDFFYIIFNITMKKMPPMMSYIQRWVKIEGLK